MYSLFENYSETPPYLVLFCAYVLIPVQILFTKMRKKRWRPPLLTSAKYLSSGSDQTQHKTSQFTLTITNHL
jgi:hypothetical protein